MELRPCPFCGELPVGDDGQVATRHTDGSKWGAVSCCCIGPEVRTGYGPVEEWRDAAIKEWNTRPIEDAQSAEIARLTADVEFWKSAAEAQRRKNCDECVRIADGEMVAKLQARVAELEGELSALRAADEGAVTVEGSWWGPEHIWLKHPGDVESCPRILRVYELSSDGYCEPRERVTVTIRKAKP